MVLFQGKEGCGGRLLVLAVFLGWCSVSVSGFGENLDSELTVLLQAGRIECFYQTALKDGSMEVEYQVVSGAGLNVDFSIISPAGVKLISDSDSSDGVHVVDPTEDGDYQLCFDNSFSRFADKMVFFEIIIEAQEGDTTGDEQWNRMEDPDVDLLEYKLDDIRDSMDSLGRRLDRSRHMQAVLRAFEARDRNLQEDNLWRVSFWSFASMLVMLCVAFTQVYTVRKLFDDRTRVCT